MPFRRQAVGQHKMLALDTPKQSRWHSPSHDAFGPTKSNSLATGSHITVPNLRPPSPPAFMRHISRPHPDQVGHGITLAQMNASSQLKLSGRPLTTTRIYTSHTAYIELRICKTPSGGIGSTFLPDNFVTFYNHDFEGLSVMSSKCGDEMGTHFLHLLAVRLLQTSAELGSDEAFFRFIRKPVFPLTNLPISTFAEKCMPLPLVSASHSNPLL